MKMKMIKLLLFCMALLLPFAGAARDGGLPAAIVGAQWLAANLGQPGLVVLDARTEQEFQLGHVRGAVNLPYTKLFGKDFLVPGLREIRDRVAAAGIDNSSRVVIYDSGEFIWAAHVFWVLQTFGVKQVALLDVSYGNWAPGLLPGSTQAPAVARANFVPRMDGRYLETLLSTHMALDSDRHTLIDVRSAAEYQGQVSRARRFGHIPGALHHPWSDNYVATPGGNRLRPLAELALVYGKLPRDQRYILYCNRGEHAALNFVVMQALGFQVAVYDGSWLEWGNNPDTPIHLPSQR